MKISELAQRTGVSVHALRHYEALGMIIPARRPNGYRECADASLREVVFIAMSRKIGFSLKAIAEQLPAYRAGQLSIEDMVRSMRVRVKDIDAHLASLAALRLKVISHIAWLEEKQRFHQTTKATISKEKAVWPAIKKSSQSTYIQPDRK